MFATDTLCLLPTVRMLLKLCCKVMYSPPRQFMHQLSFPVLYSGYLPGSRCTCFHHLVFANTSYLVANKVVIQRCFTSGTRCMAGHNKWSNIKHTKAAKDLEKQRAINLFLNKLRSFVAETGEADPKLSNRLAKLISDGKSRNIPTATIDKALGNLVAITDSPPQILAASGPFGGVMLVEVVTDKPTHTRQMLQSIVKKCGFKMMSNLAVMNGAFEEKGVILASCPENSTTDIEKFVDMAIEAGAENVTLEKDENGCDVLQFLCNSYDLKNVKTDLERRQLHLLSAEQTYFALRYVSVSASSMELVSRVMDKLYDHPNVVRLFINLTESS